MDSWAESGGASNLKLLRTRSVKNIFTLLSTRAERVSFGITY